MNKAKGERGEPLTVHVPYGYKKDPEDRKKWLADEEAAQVVKRIFTLCMEGRGPMEIAKALTEEKGLNPTAYKRRQGQNPPNPESADPLHWSTNTVVNILERREYTGCTVNFKTYTNSIWDKKQRETPEEKQAVFYNIHPAIIKPEVFDKVQEIRQQRHRRTKTGKSSMFSGLVYCADCGAKMCYCTTNYFEKRLDELDRLFIRLYEGNVGGKVSDERFAMMGQTYEDEQAALKDEAQALGREIEMQERQTDDLEQFIQRANIRNWMN